MWGARRMTIRFSFRSFSQEWDQNSRQFAEDWRIRVQSTRSIKLLGDATLSFQDTTEQTDLDYQWSGRLVSQSEISANFGLWGYERVPSSDEGYIRNVNIEAQGIVTDEYGVPVYDEDGNPVIHEGTREFYVSSDKEPA